MRKKFYIYENFEVLFYLMGVFILFKINFIGLFFF